jgi:hypothetical protein
LPSSASPPDAHSGLPWAEDIPLRQWLKKIFIYLHPNSTVGSEVPINQHGEISKGSILREIPCKPPYPGTRCRHAIGCPLTGDGFLC